MEQRIHTYDSHAPTNTERYIPTSRMQVMSSVYLPSGDMDFHTGSLRPDHRQRCRTQAMRLEKERLDKEEAKLIEAVVRENRKGGVRISTRMTVLAIAAALFFCGVYLLSQQGIIVERQKAVNRIERSISDYRSQNGELETLIGEASDAATVCYAAAQNLRMIPAESAKAIHLEAVDTRPMSRQQTQPGEETSIVTADNQAGQPASSQSTNVPAVASN